MIEHRSQMLFNKTGLRSVLPAIVAWGLLAMLAGWVVGQAYTGIVAFADYPASFDEAVRLLPTLQLTMDVQAGDWRDFFYHTYTQDEIALYPFLHSWVLVPVFMLGGPSVVLARLAGIGLVLLAALIAGGLAATLWHSLDGRYPWLAGWGSTGATLMSLPLWVYGSVVYVEALGLVLTMVALFCYVRAGPDAKRPLWLSLASIALMGALLTKYSFGVFLIGGIGLNEFLGVWLERPAKLYQRWFYLGAPVILLTLLWFSGPGKLERFWAYSRAQGNQPNVDLWFYPLSLVRHYAVGPLMLGGMVLSLGYSGFHWRRYGQRALMLYLVVGMFIVTTVPQKEIRFLYTIAPVSYVLMGVALAAVIEYLLRQGTTTLRRWGIGLVGLGLLSLQIYFVGQRWLFYHPALETAYTAPPTARQLYQWAIERSLAQGRRPYVLNEWHVVNAFALSWEYYTTTPGEPALYSYRLAQGGLAPTPEQRTQWLAQLDAQAPAAVFSIDGSPAGQYTGWQVIEPLLTSGELQFAPDMLTVTLPQFPAKYWDLALAGDFADWDTYQRVRQQYFTPVEVTVHVYYRP